MGTEQRVNDTDIPGVKLVSEEEMRTILDNEAARLRQRHEERVLECLIRNAWLHDEQRRIGEGDPWVCWVQYLPENAGDYPNPEPIFGRVVNLELWERQVVDDGWGTMRVERMRTEIEGHLDRHMLVGKAFSTSQPGGIPHDPSAGVVWPINDVMFAVARRHQWRQAEFPPWLTSHLDITRQAFLAHYERVIPHVRRQCREAGLTGFVK
jgi:hypothetical protein